MRTALGAGSAALGAGRTALGAGRAEISQVELDGLGAAGSRRGRLLGELGTEAWAGQAAALSRLPVPQGGWCPPRLLRKGRTTLLWGLVLLLLLLCLGRQFAPRHIPEAWRVPSTVHVCVVGRAVTE